MGRHVLSGRQRGGHPRHGLALRAFRTPAVYVVGPLGAASSLFLMFGLPFDTWLRFGVWLVIGLVLYAVYGVRHALGTKQPSASRA